MGHGRGRPAARPAAAGTPAVRGGIAGIPGAPPAVPTGGGPAPAATEEPAAVPAGSEGTGAPSAVPADGGTARIAYVMSRFPKLTETFVLDEILEMQRQGSSIEIFPLRRERTRLMHPDAVALTARARFTPLLSPRIVLDNARALLRSPGLYLKTLATLVRANRRSRRYLAGALAIFPKAVSLARRLRALNVCHVHAHFASHPAAAAFIVGRFAAIPWSFTAHGSDLHRDQSMLAEKLRECAFAVTISHYNRAFMLEHVPVELAEKIHVVRCGVAAERFPSAAPGAVPEGPLHLVCVGTLHEVKGQRYLLQAAAALADEGFDLRCHLIGDGPDREALAALARALGIAERVAFHGSCRRDRVLALLAQMHVAVAPSVPTADGRREGIPVSLMEAAACGLPLVASRLSGIPELVHDGETGLLVAPRDAGALTQALRRCARSPALRERLGRAARARVYEQFTLRGNVAHLRTLLMARDRVPAR